MAGYQFTLTTGRQLGVTGHGEPYAGRVVIFCHPAPGSSLFDPDPIASVRSDVHIVGIDRPGYGSSDPYPADVWPTVARAADDIASYLDDGQNAVHEFGITRMDHVGVVGWAAGGRVALALAAKFPNLVDKLALIGTPAPNDAIGWLDSGLVDVATRLAGLPAAEAIGQFGDTLRSRLAAELPVGPPDSPAPLGLLGVTDADRDALEHPGARSRLDMMMHNAFEQGMTGLATDILSYTARDWGFDLGRVRAPTLLLYGTEDPVAGPAHARWYHRHLAHARLELVPNAGHLVIIPSWQHVLEHVAPE